MVRKYRTANSLFVKPQVKAEAPHWDKPFETQEEWGEPVGMDELADLIEQVAESFHQNKPESKKDLVSVRQPTGILDTSIRGGVREHRDLDVWVTQKALPLLMKLLCSLRLNKQELERRISPEQARDIYHDTLNSLRYVYEPDDPDIEDRLVSTSGDAILPGTGVYAAELTAPNLYRKRGWCFVGDEPRPQHTTFVDEIVARLRSIEGKKLSREDGQGESVLEGEWSKPMMKADIMKALRIDSYKKLKTFSKTHTIRKAGSNKSWQIRLDGLNREQAKRLENA